MLFVIKLLVVEGELFVIFLIDVVLYECEGLILGLDLGLWVAGRILLLYLLIIFINCRYFKRKSKFGFFFRSFGYNVCVVLIVFLILLVRINFCIFVEIKLFY